MEARPATTEVWVLRDAVGTESPGDAMLQGDGVGDVSFDGIEASADLVDALAGHVRTLYCMCYRDVTGDPNYGRERMVAWDGDPTGASGRRTPNYWLRIASKLMQLQADPYQFIRAQFAMSTSARQPTPNVLLSDAAVDRWRKYESYAAEEVRCKVSSDLNQVQLHMLPLCVNLKWSEPKALEYALLSPSCAASALTKYCLAIQAGLTGVAERFRNRAIVQYLFQQAAYDSVVQGRFVVPGELQEEVRQIRSRVS